jgi:3-oxoacyl-[acyl-carrier protein] reductase
MPPQSSLSDRVALVTGANHGIGAAVARGLAARGAAVLVTYLRFTDEQARTSPPGEFDQQRAQDASSICTEITALGGAVAVETDLAEPQAARQLFDRSEAIFGPVDIVVHNASGWKKDSFSDGRKDHIGRRGFPVTTESINTQLFVDARAGALLMAEYISRHRARNATWGRIVTMTSGTGGGYPGQVSYGAAKAALISYTLSAASEMARDGVTANVVYPPVTDTGWITDDVRAFVERDPEHHHIATPDEVAETVVWLCADANHLVTGNVIRLR